MDSIQDAEVAGQLLIDGQWVAGAGGTYLRESPAYDSVVWRGSWADDSQVDASIAAAATARASWAEMHLDSRMAVCRNYAKLLQGSSEEIARQISVEVGKPLWEARTEVSAAVAKVQNSIDAILERRWTTTAELGGSLAVTRFRPHGVMLVLGPFNLPLHLPGAHIIPALLAGNTIVFKPSEYAPATGQRIAQLWMEAGAPRGVVNLVHGAADVARRAIEHAGVAGILFTGSHRVGTSIHKQLAGNTDKVLALELGGNNPLVVHRCSQLDKAAYQTILSAFITSGQRCTCARRLIVVGEMAHGQLIEKISQLIGSMRVGLPLDAQQPFMGTLINAAAAEKIVGVQTQLLENGATLYSRSQFQACSKASVSAGLLTISKNQPLGDEEHFGPLLVTQVAEDLDEAIALANATRFGLSAGFFGDRVDDYHYFLHRIRAGIVNWNRQTTGASGKLPFGGVGASGNHQPSGYFAADYCSYPVASLEAVEFADSQAHPGLELP